MQNKKGIYETVVGVYPWFSADAVSSESYYSTPQAEIDRCLNCTKAHCNNCKGKCSKEDLLDEVDSLLKQKTNWREICKLLGISRSTFYNYKQILAIA